MEATRRRGKTDPDLAMTQEGFGRCLVEGGPEVTRRTRGKAFGVSLAIEVLLVGLIVAAPFLTTAARPQLRQILPPQLTFFGVWREHNPAQHGVSLATAHNSEIPNPIPHPTMPPTMVSNVTGVEPGVPGLDLPGENVPGALEVTKIGRMPPVEPPQIAQPAQQGKHPVKISEGVLEAQLILRVEPQYPSLARQTKTQGTVRLRAIINRDGNITSLDVLSGHPLLVKAALDAVRQWRYRPTLLSGEPVEVETSITVIFRLGE